ncbi:hypothetical protein EG328_003549 [Venturia inaequalis]|uniref:BTB domain-containing protein n=1 Tax=Venturia inaequalis TaxID=5025 RepID=A0A8H3UUD2_VENIN|nr:hypothetical protein EG328_003549 [Venturia inaequalis]RDI80778.1 hypothetical protein Vi05172_g9251 [Venturia inaequalis]
MVGQKRRIIAGAGLHERTFNVPVSVLNKSPIISDWVHDKDSIPSHMLRGNDFLFASIEPDVVQATINYLSHTPRTFGPPIERLPFVTSLQKIDVLFRVKLYKFALCLGLTELCEDSLIHIESLTYSTNVFLRVLTTSMEERMGLVDETQFRKWLIKYIKQNRVNLTNSPLFKDAISNNSALAWKICSLLMSALGDTESGTEPLKPPTPNNSSMHTPLNVQVPATIPIIAVAETNRLLSLPPSSGSRQFEQRTGSPYSHPPRQKSPKNSPFSIPRHNSPSTRIAPDFERRTSSPHSYPPQQKSSVERHEHKRGVPPEFEQRTRSPYAYRPQLRTSTGGQNGWEGKQSQKTHDKRFRATVEDAVDEGDQL